MTDTITPTQQVFPRLDTPFTQETRGSVAPKSAVVDVRGALIAIPWYRLLITLWNRTGGTSGGGTVITGMMVLWPASAIPDGWLECNGTAVSRTNFASLFSVLGVTWGSGDGSSTFNLPDLRDRVPVGASGTKPVGHYAGSNSLTLSVGQLPAHSHSVTDPGHAHVQQVKNTGTAGALGTQGASAANDTSVGTTDSSTTGITVNDTGSGDPIDITPSYGAAKWIIKT